MKPKDFVTENVVTEENVVSSCLVDKFYKKEGHKKCTQIQTLEWEHRPAEEAIFIFM